MCRIGAAEGAAAPAMGGAAPPDQGCVLDANRGDGRVCSFTNDQLDVKAQNGL
jgi:hypothetical protein